MNQDYEVWVCVDGEPILTHKAKAGTLTVVTQEDGKFKTVSFTNVKTAKPS